MPYYRRLRDLREDHDLTQRQLAAILRMPQPQYNRYEQGLRDLPTHVLIELADLYQTSTDYLLGRTENSAPPESFR
ncbi:MAG: helix-turn-helix domain-containing protein [Faecalibacterium sp.]